MSFLCFSVIRLKSSFHLPLQYLERFQNHSKSEDNDFKLRRVYLSRSNIKKYFLYDFYNVYLGGISLCINSLSPGFTDCCVGLYMA